MPTGSHAPNAHSAQTECSRALPQPKFLDQVVIRFAIADPSVEKQDEARIVAFE